MPYKNNWIPTKTLEEMAMENYDVLIVGLVQVEGQPCIDSANYGKIKVLKKLGLLKR